MSTSLNTAQAFALKALKAALRLATDTGLFDILTNHQKTPNDINVFCDLVEEINDESSNPMGLTTVADFHQSVGEFSVDSTNGDRRLNIVNVWDMDRDFLGLFLTIPNGMNPDQSIVLIDAAVREVKLERPEDYSSVDLYAKLVTTGIRPVTMHRAGESW